MSYRLDRHAGSSPPGPGVGVADDGDRHGVIGGGDGGGDADDGRTEGVGTVVTVVTDAVGEEEGVVGRVVVRGGGL